MGNLNRNGVTFRPTITTSASLDYSSGDVISGIITLTNAASDVGRQALLMSVAMKDDSNQGPALSLIFFRATPSGGTYTDNSQLVWGSGDLANVVGYVRIGTSDWYSPAASVAKALFSTGAIKKMMSVADAAKDLFMLIVADETINFASTSDLTLELSFERR